MICFYPARPLRGVTHLCSVWIITNSHKKYIIIPVVPASDNPRWRLAFKIPNTFDYLAARPNRPLPYRPRCSVSAGLRFPRRSALECTAGVSAGRTTPFYIALYSPLSSPCAATALCLQVRRCFPHGRGKCHGMLMAR